MILEREVVKQLPFFLSINQDVSWYLVRYFQFTNTQSQKQLITIVKFIISLRKKWTFQ